MATALASHRSVYISEPALKKQTVMETLFSEVVIKVEKPDDVSYGNESSEFFNDLIRESEIFYANIWPDDAR